MSVFTKFTNFNSCQNISIKTLIVSLMVAREKLSGNHRNPLETMNVCTFQGDQSNNGLDD